MKYLFIMVSFILLSSTLYAVDSTVLSKSNLDAQLELFYKEAEQAIEKGDNQRADFYLARYIGKSMLNEDTDKNMTDLYPLFEKQNLAPTSLLSRDYNKEFIEWFVYSPAHYWARDEVIEEDIQYTFRLNGTDDNNYYVVVSAYPFIEAWSVAGQEDAYSTAFIALAGKPFIMSGKLKDGKSSKEFNRVELDALLQRVWRPELYDLDNDGIPEIWIRYNRTMGTGFSQELVIYKIEDNKIKLFKKFEGSPEGIARRLKNGNIEIGYSFSDESVGHLGYDKHHIEEWQYKDGDFVKVSEKDIPHILYSSDWKDYYFAKE